MKYNYQFNVLRYLVLLGILAIFSNSGLRAQGLSTNTTYVVNGANNVVLPVDTFPNLTGPNGALTYLNANGMNATQSSFGPVIFLLSAGYNPVEPNVLNIGQATGAGGWPNMYWNSNSPVVIKPAPGQSFNITTTSTVAASAALVRFNGTWYAGIDGNNGSGGRNLSFVMPSASTGANRVIDIMPTSGQRCQFISVKNCNIVGNSSATAPNTYAGVYMGGASNGTATALGQNQNIEVINNYIIAVQNGVYFRGLANASNQQSKNITINNNIIGDYSNTYFPANTPFIGASAASGIYLNSIANAVVSGNTIRNTALISANFRGIFLTNEGASVQGVSCDSNIQVINNNIYNLNTTASSAGVFGIRMSLGTHNQHLRILIANNSISKLSATLALNNLAGLTYPIGILIDDNSTNVGAEVFFNSVYLTGSTLPANSFSACFATGTSTNGGIIMMNNSFANKMGRNIGASPNTTGYTVYNVLTTNSVVGNQPFRFCSFNNYYTTTFDGGNAYISRFKGVDYVSLNSLKTINRSDTTSFSTIPPFKNDSDLTVDNGVSHYLYNRGVDLTQFSVFYPSIYDSIRFKVNTDINGRLRVGMGRFTPIGCHFWNGDSLNNNVPLGAGKLFPINGYSSWPTSQFPTGSFATISEAIDYLNHYGVSGIGEVVLEVQPGYNGETVHLPALINYPFASNATPVTFRTQANFSTNVTIPNLAGMNNISILRFLGARSITFDGGSNKGFTFSMPLNSTNVNSRIIGITPVDTASTDITIKNCRLIGNSTSAIPNTSIGIYVGNVTTLTGAPVVSTKGGINNINLIGNEISAVRTGIAYFSLINSSNVKIKSNIIGGTIAPGGAANTTYIGGAASNAGIWLKGMTSSYIDSNVVRNCVPTAAVSNGFFGVYLDEAGGSDFSGVSVTRNFVYNLVTVSGTYCAGIRLNIKAGGVGRGITLYNNFIGSIIGNGAAGSNFSNINPAGISIDAQGVQTSIGIALAHNTVNLTGNGLGASGCSSAALFLGANVQGGIEMVNNIWGNRINRTAGTGNRYAVLIGHTASPFTAASALPFACNMNNYFAVGNGTNYIGANTNGTINRASINDWRAFTAATTAGIDGNSFNWMNTFKTDTTPDIDLLYGGLVPGGATVVTGVCDDIYGNSRYLCSGGSTTVTRWVGAAEVGFPFPALQGNVTYPINGISDPPTPLRPGSGSFKTVRNAIDYLNSQGVDDPSFGGFRTIRLEIANGYVGETDTFVTPITVLDYPRQSNTRPVVLTIANGRTDTIRLIKAVNTGNMANASFIRLSGCKYFSIDGNNGVTDRALTIALPSSFTATTNNKVIDIISGFNPITAFNPFTTNNTIKNCNIVGASTPTSIATFAGVYSGGLTTPSNSLVGTNDNNTIQNNFIGAVQNGVYLRGNGPSTSMDNNNAIIRNTIGGTIGLSTAANTNYIGTNGIFVQSQSGLNISGNTIRNTIPTGTPKGIELATTATVATVLCNSVKIDGNIINNIRGGSAAYGIYLNFGSDNNNVNRDITISNNMISGVSATGSIRTTSFALNPFGIYFNASSNIGTGNTYVGVSLYYNSINMNQEAGLTVANSLSACVGIPSFIRSGVVSQNNVYQNRLGGAGAALNNSYSCGVAIGGATSPFYTSNFNDYFTSTGNTSITANVLGNATAATPGVYNQWFEILSFTGQDTLSFSSLAPFTNDNNLFIPINTSSNLFQAGKPVSSVLYDINGDARSPFIPSVGAHEFQGTYLDDIAPRIFNVTDPTGCQSGIIQINFNIYDKQLSADTFYYKINGGAVNAVQASIKNGSFRSYLIPAQTSGTLIEYRLAAIDFLTPPNTGYYPANKPWDTISTGITNFPYATGFEGVNNPAWSSQSLSGGASWEIGVMGSNVNPPQGARSGIKSAMFRSSTFASSGSSARLVSPCVDFSNMSSPTMRFYISQNSDLPTKRDSIQVKVSFGGNIWSNALRTVQRVNNDYPLPGYKMVEVCLSAFKTSGLRIAIEAYGAGAGQNIQIDDITIYDDVQSQPISPKVFSQCYKDSIRINISNPDARFNYRVVNYANGQTLASKDGDGSSMYIGFATPPVDTIRYFVEASNMTSQSINTGFGGGFITCSNILPDTIEAVVNRFYNGPFVTAGLPFNGSYNVGDGNNPDGSKIGDTITYRFVPPAFYTNASYGTSWSLPLVQAFVQGSGAPYNNYTFVPPSGSGPGYIRLIAPANLMDSNIVFNFRIRINASSCDSNFVRVLRIAGPPTANFTYTPPAANLCATNNINFNAISSIKPANNFPFTYTWIFGDGTFSFVENPTKVYNTPGTYLVRFILTDRYGLSSEKSESVTILPSPVANFSTNVPCASDSTVFTPTSQPAGSSFLWTMSNNSTQTREVAKYNFAQFDTAYDVTLKITNTSGCFSVIKKSIYVFAKPTANWSTSPVCLSSNVPITNTSSIPVGVMGYNWSWGNGQTSLSATPTYKYPASGTYTATLKVSSAFGCIDSLTKAITVYDRPFVSFTAVNNCYGENSATVFNNSTTFAGGAQNVNYSWNFGDLSTSTLQSPTHNYTAPANFIVSVLAVDKINGCRDSLTKTIPIYYKPNANFAISPEAGICVGNQLQVINTSYSIDQKPFSCNWTWGDSKTDTICNIGGHVYANHGAYTIRLIITSSDNCTDTFERTLVAMDPPVLDIAVKDTDVASYPYTLNRKLLTASIADAESWTWNMGDAQGSTRTGRLVDFVFAQKGKYNVKCTVKDLNGCTVEKTVEVEIFGNVGVQNALSATYDVNAYPNPFGQSTNLSFELPKAANVKVSVMDMLGRTLKTSDLGSLSAGKHNQLLEDFASAGTYLVKLEIDGVSVYKQVIKQ